MTPEGQGLGTIEALVWCQAVGARVDFKCAGPDGSPGVRVDVPRSAEPVRNRVEAWRPNFLSAVMAAREHVEAQSGQARTCPQCGHETSK